MFPVVTGGPKPGATANEQAVSAGGRQNGKTAQNLTALLGPPGMKTVGGVLENPGAPH